MNRREYTKLIAAKWPYMPMRPGRDLQYREGIDVAQLHEWRKAWIRGPWFGLVSPLPDYSPEDFDCDDEVVDFIAYCVRRNAGTGKALPICFAAITGHAVLCFVERGTCRIGFFDVRKGEISFGEIERPEYLELV